MGGPEDAVGVVVELVGFKGEVAFALIDPLFGRCSSLGAIVAVGFSDLESRACRSRSCI